MATRSWIARYSIQKQEYVGIYCHWDGYPEHNGVILRDHYSHDGEVQVLLGRGNISSLRTPGGRDIEGEDAEWQVFGEPATIHHELAELLEYAKGSGCEYAYIWNAHLRSWDCWNIRYTLVDLSKVSPISMELANA